ncbi:transglutaminase-like domain-containing protein [Phorcysia thermohydrogeniphila]|uniref:Transglutaminase superfamily protein n=1 Tax=Phorcysia thermohydrogeniphila TaxID=936138 RepID=A0A4R1GDZ8_9BACT|nr:transglutaminase-like domain-containing protein [Phorcysia thermohydrogeniphila]TCK06364.1 transglutaminase superfamily protein [Phorcysia thermohydrogeniphila]
MDYGKLASLGVEPEKVSKFPEAYRIRLTSNDQSLAILEELSREYALHPRIRSLVAGIIRPCKEKNYDCYIARIAEFVRRNVKYVNDPPRTEVFQSPVRTLEYGIGDCDDFAVLTASLLRAVGLNTRIKIKKVNERWGHVVTEVFNPNRGWIEVDTTKKEVFELGGGVIHRPKSWYFLHMHYNRPKNVPNYHATLFLARKEGKCVLTARHPCAPLVCPNGRVIPSPNKLCQRKHYKPHHKPLLRPYHPARADRPVRPVRHTSSLQRHITTTKAVEKTTKGAHKEGSFPWWALIAGGAVVYALW